MNENAGPRVEVYLRLEEVEAELLATKVLPSTTREGYRTLLDTLYEDVISGESAATWPALDDLCDNPAACQKLTSPSISVAYPHCYRRIAREYDLPDSTDFWAVQGEIWSEFFRAGNWSKERTLRSIDATSRDRFTEFEVRAFYTQHALFLISMADRASTTR